MPETRGASFLRLTHFTVYFRCRSGTPFEDFFSYPPSMALVWVVVVVWKGLIVGGTKMVDATRNISLPHWLLANSEMLR